MGGAVLGSTGFINDILLPFHRHTGPALSPFNAWVLNKSLETFSLRAERHFSNAEKIAAYLESRSDKLSRTIYPGATSHPQHALAMSQQSRGGALVTFEMKGGKEAAFRFMNALELIVISNNLGDARSLIAHPATTTHASLGAEERAKHGITDGMLRLSVGLEAVDDLLVDLKTALDAA